MDRTLERVPTSAAAFRELLADRTGLLERPRYAEQVAIAIVADADRRASAPATKCCGSATAAAPPTRSISRPSSAAASCASARGLPSEALSVNTSARHRDRERLRLRARLRAAGRSVRAAGRRRRRHHDERHLEEHRARARSSQALRRDDGRVHRERRRDASPKSPTSR